MNSDVSVRFMKDAHTWIFTLPEESQDPSRSFAETITIIEQIFSSMETFIVPMELELVIHVADNPEGEVAIATTTSVQSRDGLTFGVLSDIVKFEDGEDVWKSLTRFDIVSNRTKIWLGDEDHWIATGSDRYKIGYDSEATEPPSDLFEIVLFRNNAFSEKPIGGNQLVVWTHSDIWFQDDEIGRINRERLGAMLRELRDRCNATDVEFETEMPGARGIREQAIDDLGLNS